MDFWRTVLVLFHRWYISVPAFFATLVVAGAAYTAVPVQYQSDSVLVLTTPVAGGTQATDPQTPTALTNPLLTFDRSVALAASVVIQQMNSSESTVALGVVPGGATAYKVTNGSTNPELQQTGPFLFVEGTGPTPEAAQDVVAKVSAMATQVLAQRQDELKAPKSTHITMQVVVPPTEGQPLSGSRLRAFAAVGALAGLASLAAVFGFESLMTYRRRRRAAPEQTVKRVDTVPTAPPTTQAMASR